MDLSLGLLIDIFLHTPKYLDILFNEYHLWAYAFLFLLFFLETGIVITPFLPGDSVLFGVGAIAAGGLINIPAMLVVLCLAAILGDSTNYQIGRLLGHKVESRERIPLVKQEHIIRTQAYFERHGGKTITLARFIPIIRTFAPFVAGAAHMEYKRFFTYNVVGALIWVGLMFGSGYFFGNLAVVQENFSLIIIMIILISFTPLLIALFKKKKKPSVDMG